MGCAKGLFPLHHVQCKDVIEVTVMVGVLENILAIHIDLAR